jgi:hypothetical protein
MFDEVAFLYNPMQSLPPISKLIPPETDVIVARLPFPPVTPVQVFVVVGGEAIPKATTRTLCEFNVPDSGVVVGLNVSPFE